MFHIIIPARYHSTRLPAKPLIELAGLPMIAHVYQRALASGASSIVVATDDERIAAVVRDLGGDVFISDIPHESGTARLAEVVTERGYNENDIIVNLQGDEPFMPVDLLQQIATLLQQHSDAAMATLYAPCQQASEVFDPNIVKVILDERGYALYFSRAPIPWLRDTFIDLTNMPDFSANLFYRHIGLYAYRASFVKQYGNLTQSPIEQYECLEQLRVLWHGYKIILAAACFEPGQEINTPEDLNNARLFLENRSDIHLP